MSQVHSYIADAAQLKGFREGTISSVWAPIDFSSMGPWWRLRTVNRVFRYESDIEGLWRIESSYNDRPYEAMIHCPYAVEDELWVHSDTEQENGDLLMENCTRIISSVEAKVLGKMTYFEAVSSGIVQPPATEVEHWDRYYMADDEIKALIVDKLIVDNWNARYPEQPWDKDLWCWVVGVGATDKECLTVAMEEHS